MFTRRIENVEFFSYLDNLSKDMVLLPLLGDLHLLLLLRGELHHVPHPHLGHAAGQLSAQVVQHLAQGLTLQSVQERVDVVLLEI